MTAHGVLLCHFALTEVGRGDAAGPTSPDWEGDRGDARGREPGGVQFGGAQLVVEEGTEDRDSKDGAKDSGEPQSGVLDAGLLDASRRADAHVDPQEGVSSSYTDPGSARV